MTLGKIPANIDKFYERNNLEAPMSPEEEEAKKSEAEAVKGKPKPKPKAKAKPGKKKPKKVDDSKNIVKIGPSEVVLKFD